MVDRRAKFMYSDFVLRGCCLKIFNRKVGMDLSGKHILTTKMFDLDQLQDLFNLADFLKPVAQGEKSTRVLDGAILSSLFFEPSTRTRLSFDSSFMKLGGSVSNTTGFETSSIIKGESLCDTSRVISGYSDVIVIRHPTNGAVAEFASATNIPVINGGCGSEEHPTQSLLDLYTLENELKRIGKKLTDITIAFVGDLKYGRTVHSLLQLLSLTKGINYVFVSPKTLGLPSEYLNLISHTAGSIHEYTSLKDLTSKIDVIYSTRIQRERIPQEDRVDSNNGLRITKEIVDMANVECIMHPLPRDSRDMDFDLSNDLNNDDRLAVFRQTDSGIQIRMALFCKVMGVDKQVLNSLHNTTWWRPKYIGTSDASFYLHNSKQ